MDGQRAGFFRSPSSWSVLLEIVVVVVVCLSPAMSVPLQQDNVQVVEAKAKDEHKPSQCRGYTRSGYRIYITTDCNDTASRDLPELEGGTGTGRFLLVANGIRWEYRRMDTDTLPVIPEEAILTVIYPAGSFYQYLRTGNESSDGKPARYLRHSHRARSRNSAANAIFRKMASRAPSFQWRIYLFGRCPMNSAGNVVCSDVTIRSGDEQNLRVTIDENGMSEMARSTASKKSTPSVQSPTGTVSDAESDKSSEQSEPTERTSAATPAATDQDTRAVASDALHERVPGLAMPHGQHVCEKFRVVVICD